MVIISYPGSARYTGGTVTTNGANTVHRFTTSANLTPIVVASDQFLVANPFGDR